MKLRSFIMLLLWSALVLPVPAAPQPSSPAAPVRPLVLFIHGRDQAGKNVAELQALWYAAFEAGEAALNVSGMVLPGDRGFVWYGDIYGQTPPPVPDECRFALEGLGTSLEERLRRTLIRIAARAGLARAAADLFVHDTYLYFSDVTTRCSTELRVEQALQSALSTRRPVVIVAHSMGAIVAFGVLQENAHSPTQGRYNAARFVTLGAQLSVPEILQATQGSMIQPPIPEPQNVRSWINVKNRGDRLAFTMAGFFKATDKSREPQELRIAARGPAKHSITSYLSHPETARAILSAWCEAFANAEQKPGGCQKVLSR